MFLHFVPLVVALPRIRSKEPKELTVSIHSPIHLFTLPPVHPLHSLTIIANRSTAHLSSADAAETAADVSAGGAAGAAAAAAAADGDDDDDDGGSTRAGPPPRHGRGAATRVGPQLQLLQLPRGHVHPRQLHHRHQ